MKFLKIVIVMLVLITSVGAVCATDALSDDVMSEDGGEIVNAVPDIEMSDTLETVQDDVYSEGEGSFTDLFYEIYNETSVFDMTRDYKFNNETDPYTGIPLQNDNFILNGNGHTVDGDGQSRIFTILGNNITICNLNIINGNLDEGSAIYVNSETDLTTANVTFDNNKASESGGAVYVGGQYTSVNDRFVNNDCAKGSAIYVLQGALNMNNGTFISDRNLSWGLIYSLYSVISIENTTFANVVSNYSTALYIQDSKGKIRNCDFVNLTARLTAGAIGIKSVPEEIIIENCNFTNTCSQKDGGAIFVDVAGMYGTSHGNVSVINSRFVNCSSEFGGAILHLDGCLSIEGSDFISNIAMFDGGAVYTSWANVTISNSSFVSNNGLTDGFSNGGACYFDNGIITLDGDVFENNSASQASSLYAYDCNLTLSDNFFSNPSADCASIYTVFDKDYQETGNNFTGDVVSLNNTNYVLNVDGSQTAFVLLNNTIDVTALPSRFDLRDWGWVSPVKNQGRMGACWTFGATGSLESALIRYTNITYDFSENNLQNTMLRYSKYGSTSANEGGNPFMSLEYYVSWLGVSPAAYDVYDELGKISPLIATLDDVHIVNVVLIPPRANSTDNDKIKEAIIKYGSLVGSYNHDFDPIYLNDTTYAYYYNNGTGTNHAIGIVGWDDNYAKENFVITPPGDGAWIIKNSWGANWGDGGYFYISYYDTSIVTSGYAAAFVIDNTTYENAYQHETSVTNQTGHTYSMNVFVAQEGALIGAVGTFFDDADDIYEFSIFVNGVNVYNQSGVREFIGFSTIPLDSYIPIKTGDEFKVMFKKSSTTFGSARFHVQPNTSFMSYDGVEWEDATQFGMAAIIKAYALVDDTQIVDNEDISVDYAGGSFFGVRIATADGHAVGAGANVTFTINGNTVTATTGSDGIAGIEITEVPGVYTVTTTYNNVSLNNTVTVKHVIKASKATVKKSSKKFALKAKLKINGKAIKGKKITFKLNGKKYTAKTDKKGIAKVTFKKNVIKKLKKGKTYKVKVAYLKDKVKTTVTVR